ncbi:MAG: urea carboxylase-associated family protein [Thermodesulfobacteriota bacterium]
MARKIVNELVITKGEGRAFEVMKGQVFRVIDLEGRQVGDMTLLSLRDFREKFSSQVTVATNGMSFKEAKKLYSGPPRMNVMLTVIEDKVGAHWIHGRCTRLYYQTYHGSDKHRNCQQNIADALKPYGLTEYDVPFGTFNIFMNVEVDENCHFKFHPPLSKKGDYIDFLAEMDVLVAISACPETETVVNDYAIKPLKIEIYERD